MMVINVSWVYNCGMLNINIYIYIYNYLDDFQKSADLKCDGIIIL